MRLSSANLTFMEVVVSTVILQGLDRPVGLADANAMLFIALYMCQDPTAHMEMMELMRGRDPRVLNIWRTYVGMVIQRNYESTEITDKAIQELLDRAKNR